MSGGRRSRRVLIGSLVPLAAGVLAIVWASVNTPGPTNFVELDNIPGIGANQGFDFLGGATFDWANSGAAAAVRDCTNTPITGGVSVTCNGSGGLFDGGVFHSATTPPDPPSKTAAAAADPSIVDAEFRVDPLSVDNALVHNPPDDPTAPTVACGTGDPTVYTGVGSETNGDDLNQETYNTGSVPNKDEISNAYAISHQVPPNPAFPSPTDTNEIFAGFERVVNNGDSHVDLEFLQSSVNLVPGSKASSFPCAGKFQGHRSQGDLLLSIDFTIGGSIGSPILHKWACGDFPPAAGSKVCDPVKNPGKKIPPHYEAVSDAQTTAAVSQRVNGGAAIGCGGWGCRNADGTQTDTVAQNEFYEVGIDMAALGFEGCLSTFLPHTRSSQSFTATLKDFSIIPFNTCAPSTKLTKSASADAVLIGGSVTYTYVETNDGNVPLTSPSVTDDKCSPVTYASGDGNTNGVLDQGEAWTFKCTANNLLADTTNTAVGHGTFTIEGVAKDVTWCSDPASPPTGVICDQDERAQATVLVKNPTTRLTKTPSATPVIIGDSVTYTYVETNDGNVALSNVSVADDKCAPVTFSGGDGNGNGLLDPGESWTFTCTLSNLTQTVSNTAIGHGSFTLGATTYDVTWCADPLAPPAGVLCDQDERAGATVVVKTPSTRLVKAAAPTVVTTVVYTYSETNDGDVPLTGASVEDGVCTSHGGTVAFNGGDTNGNGILDPGETWVFKCTATFNGPGTFTDIAVGHGSFTSGGVTKDVTVCPSGPTAGKFCDPDETDTKTVEVCTPTVSGGK